jgi:hypothetical protein
MAGKGPGRPKGLPKTGGRAKGTPNKVTQEFRQTVCKLLETNAENVGRWLEQVANGYGRGKNRVPRDPGKALDLLAKLAEYGAAKLGRLEVAGDKTRPLTIKVLRFSDAG